MNSLHPQYVVDANQTPTAVLLPVGEWEQVIEDLEELDDIRAYDQAKAGPQETVSFEQAVREIEEGSGQVTYKVEILRSAQAQLAKIAKQDRNRITSAIRSLANTPRPHGSRKLAGRPA